jgi:hypothetical protein
VRTLGTEGKPAATAEILAIAGTQSTRGTQATAMTLAKLVAAEISKTVLTPYMIHLVSFRGNSRKTRQNGEKILKKLNSENKNRPFSD